MVLSKSQIKRIENIYELLKDVETKSLQQWIEGFVMDAAPSREIAIWEQMALAYSSFCDGKNLSLSAKQEVLRLSLKHSLGYTSDYILSMKTMHLNQDDRREFLLHYATAKETLNALEQRENNT